MGKMRERDRERLRDLAKRQVEIANSPEMAQIEEDWMASNSLRPNRPMVTVELATFAGEVIPDMLQCEGEKAREIEALLCSNLVNHTMFGDDTVVRDFIPVGIDKYFVPFGIQVKQDHAKEGGVGHHFVEVLTNLEEDFDKLGTSEYGLDKDASLRRVNEFNDILGDILPARLAGGCMYAVLTQNIIHIMSMENFFMAMYDAPDQFHEMMGRLAQDYLQFFDMLEREHAILPTTKSEWVGQGTYAYTQELPEDATSWSQTWLFMDSQETVGLSPAMFEEFIFPYYNKIASKAGLVSYGCCEPVDPIWDTCLSKWKNLRKVSISPWCNEEIMAQRLKGTPVVYHRKPSPNFIGVGSTLDEPAVRKSIGHTVQLNQGRSLEFTQRDVYTIHHDISKVKRYVEIIREECAEKW